MKKRLFILFAGFALILGNAATGHAERGGWHGGGDWHRGGDWHGDGLRGGWGPGWGLWWDPGFVPSYPYPVPYDNPQVIIQQEPQFFQQQQPQEQHYWYYCEDSKGYYPYVKQCPNGWMTVVPTPSPTSPEE